MFTHFRRLAVLAIVIACSVSAHATTYYLSPSGQDSNNGLSTIYAWASPNHSLNCGDVILASPGSYSNANFYTGKWGHVNCPAGNSVAWLKCATFDTCKIYASNNQGMWVDESYWGVQGWEISTNAYDSNGACFMAAPRWTNKVTIHHIIFANDVANGCSQSGFESINFGTASVDYFTVLGSIAYNAAQGSASCASGISVYQPAMSDTASGTHIYIAGNLTYANVEPNMCNGTSPTDGEGIIFDTFDGSQGGIPPYWGQAVAYTNLVIGNGGRGIEIYNNQVGTYHARFWINQNTIWGSNSDPNQSWYGCSELSIMAAKEVHTYGNLVSTNRSTGCGGHPIYAIATSEGDSTDTDDYNFAFGYNGYTTFQWSSGAFYYNSDNHFGTYPGFRDAFVPGAPQCGGKANAVACMATVAADFLPTVSGSGPAGYHAPLSTSVSDVLFPHWLCTANVPAGLVTMGCS